MGDLERLATGSDAPANPRYNPYSLACDVARALGIGGPVLAVSNACASGLIAMVEAARILERGEADAVLVVGVDVLTDFVLSGFSAFRALSPQPCRPYDADRDGLSLGEGAGALCLAREPAEGEHALAELAGWGISNDANHITAPSRTGDGLRNAVGSALVRAGMECYDVHYVNGHGTGTVYNDAMEARALCDALAGCPVPVSSMKGYFGHTLGAAGVIEAAICLTALRERTVPASLGLSTPGVGRPLRVARSPLALGEMENVLSVKSGFGGVNAAVILSRPGGGR